MQNQYHKCIPVHMMLIVLFFKCLNCCCCDINRKEIMKVKQILKMSIFCLSPPPLLKVLTKIIFFKHFQNFSSIFYHVSEFKRLHHCGTGLNENFEEQAILYIRFNKLFLGIRRVSSAHSLTLLCSQVNFMMFLVPLLILSG